MQKEIESEVLKDEIAWFLRSTLKYHSSTKKERDRWNKNGKCQLWMKLGDRYMRVSCTLNILKKKIRGYSWTLTRVLPKKSTLNVNRKIIPETPQMHPCYFSNIPARFPPQGLCPPLFPLLGMLFTHMSTWLAPSLFQISTLRSPWPSYIKQQNPNTNILAHSIPPALLYFVSHHLSCFDIQNVCLLCLSSTTK